MKKCPNCDRLNPDDVSVCSCGFSNLANVRPIGDNQWTPNTDVKTYLAPAILTTIFCCSPFGIVGIYYAGKTKARLEVGDPAGALEFSKEAKRWSWIAFGVGLAVWLLYIIFIIVAAVTGFSHGFH